jgi:SHS2 domain-containing protein
VKRPDYRLIDHTADMAYEVEGASFEHLLETATAALADIVLDCEHATLDESRELAVGGADREDVLVAWLNEVVVAFEEDGFLAWDADVEHADERGARGVLRGRTLDFDHEQPDRVVKAVTYHDLSVREGSSGRPWSAQIVLDL